MEWDVDGVLAFWHEDREELSRLRQAGIQDERALYALALQLRRDAQSIHQACDQLDRLTIRLSETAD